MILLILRVGEIGTVVCCPQEALPLAMDVVFWAA